MTFEIETINFLVRELMERKNLTFDASIRSFSRYGR